MATVDQFIKALKNQIGVKYTFGGKIPSAGLDCSGLITYALSSVKVGFVNGSSNQIKACQPITMELALKTPGALLWREGHDAISLGDGTSIEAVVNPGNAVGIFPNAGKRFTKAGLIPGVDYTNGKVETMPRMVSPFEGRVTAQWRGYKNHAGMDIAPPKPGQTGRPVYSAFDGVVIRTASGVRHGNRKSTWAPGRTGNGVLIRNADGEANGYNHVRPIVKSGQRVKAGDIIGYNDTSGNQSGPHLHFELWANWRNAGSDYDPRLAFDKFGIKPGSRPITITLGTARPAPVKKPSAPVRQPVPAVKKALKQMGLPQNIDGVKAYQRHHGLVDDGDWGTLTIRKYRWVKSLQRALNLMKSSSNIGKVTVDGYQGNGTNRRKNDILKRNKWTNNNLVANLKAVKAWK